MSIYRGFTTVGCVVFLILPGLPGRAFAAPQRSQYVYTDDFSTSQATVDSYDHSPFDVYPGYALYGYLAYVSPSPPDNVLGFFRGYEACPPEPPPSPCEAHLAYCFPVGPEPGGLQSGTVQFDYSLYPPGSENGHLQLFWSQDGSSWVPLLDPIPEQHNEYTIVPPTPGGHLYLQFVGLSATIDNLEISLTLDEIASMDRPADTANTDRRLSCRVSPPAADQWAEFAYRLPATAEVDLSVYDSLGRHVAALIEDEQGPGLHAVRCSTSALESGVYFYRLVAGKATATGRMLVVR
jgi:hypothetical protein